MSAGGRGGGGFAAGEKGNRSPGGGSWREVYAVAEDGNRITGRWFDPDRAEAGGEWVAIRDGGPPQVLAVFPQALAAGSAATVTIVGTGLGAKAASVSFGEGTIATNVQREEHDIRARVKVAADAAP